MPMFLLSIFLCLSLNLSVSNTAQREQRSRDHVDWNARLLRAIYRNNTQAALNALAHGANPNAHKWLRKKGVAPAFRASALVLALDWRWRDQYQLGHFLVDGYMPVNPPPENADIVRALLQRGAHVNERNETGLQPIHLASWQGKASSVALLLRFGADVNVLGVRKKYHGYKSTPLMLAVANGDAKTVVFLVLPLFSHFSLHLPPLCFDSGPICTTKLIYLIYVPRTHICVEFRGTMLPFRTKKPLLYARWPAHAKFSNEW